MIYLFLNGSNLATRKPKKKKTKKRHSYFYLEGPVGGGGIGGIFSEFDVPNVFHMVPSCFHQISNGYLFCY